MIIVKTGQTPIEMALQVDDDGTVSAKRVYEFLELDPKNYARWCKKNIIDNEFAEEHFDYTSFVLHDERYNPKPTTEYKLSASFAKKLCMMAKSERGEMAREYFLKVEEILKKRDSQSDRIKIQAMNARARLEAVKVKKAELLFKLTNVDTLSTEYKNILVNKATEVLSGTPLLPEKASAQKTYSATELGEIFGVSAQKIGVITNKHNLKQPQYGEWYRDKSPHSSKEVDSFRYYDSVIQEIQKYV